MEHLYKNFLYTQKNQNQKLNFIGFFHENEPYGCFSNWYPAEFNYAGRHFMNVEQFMMFHKVMMFGKINLAKQIMSTSNPAVCKQIARQKFPEFNATIWKKTCRVIVKRGVRAKFQQNEHILKTLLKTGNALLAECSPYDKKWGIGIDIYDDARLHIHRWKGKNYLGVVLMEVRDELRQEIIFSGNGNLQYVEARDAGAISEWRMTAGELKRIPQYYKVIHAYVDTFSSYHLQNSFYHQYPLEKWEMLIRHKKSGDIPTNGFYEMKQDIYDTAHRLELFNNYIKGTGLQND